MHFVNAVGLLAVLCLYLTVTAQNFTDLDQQLAAYLEENNLTGFNITSVRVRDSVDVKIAPLGCSIAVCSISSRPQSRFIRDLHSIVQLSGYSSSRQSFVTWTD
jgi:hypothetical protein